MSISFLPIIREELTLYKMGKKGKRKMAAAGNGKKVPQHNQEVLQLCSEILNGMYKAHPFITITCYV